MKQMTVQEYRKMAKRKIAAPKKAVKIRSISAEKTWMSFNLFSWAKERGLIVLPEFPFVPGRRFRADWAVDGLNILIEYEGLMSAKSRHTTIQGFSTDCEKYNMAVREGFSVLRYTARNYKQVISDLNHIYEQRIGYKPEKVKARP